MYLGPRGPRSITDYRCQRFPNFKSRVTKLPQRNTGGSNVVGSMVGTLGMLLLLEKLYRTWSLKCVTNNLCDRINSECRSDTLPDCGYQLKCLYPITSNIFNSPNDHHLLTFTLGGAVSRQKGLSPYSGFYVSVLWSETIGETGMKETPTESRSDTELRVEIFYFYVKDEKKIDTCVLPCNKGCQSFVNNRRDNEYRNPLPERSTV